MDINYNEALDFVYAVYRLANREYFRIRKQDLAINGITEIEDWCIKMEKECSPFFLSDLDILVKQLPTTNWLMVTIARKPTPAANCGEFFERLDALSENDLLKMVYDDFKFESDAEVTKELILHRLTELVSDSPSDPEKEAEMILQFTEKPEIFFKRIKNLYHEFYNSIFTEQTLKFQKLSETRLKWHRNQLQKNPVEYLDGITTKTFSTFYDGSIEPILYYSVFADFDFTFSINDIVIIIGAGTDEFIKSESNLKKTNMLFSILGDSKRLELLRLVTHRAWYSRELAEHFDVKPATMSYHLSKMVASGLLKLQRGDQKRFYYMLNRESMKDYLKAATENLLGPEDKNE